MTNSYTGSVYCWKVSTPNGNSGWYVAQSPADALKAWIADSSIAPALPGTNWSVELVDPNVSLTRQSDGVVAVAATWANSTYSSITSPNAPLLQATNGL